MKRYVVATLALLFCVSMLPWTAVAAPIAKFSDLILVDGPWVDVRGYGTISFGAGVSDEQKLANTATIQGAIDASPSGSVITIPPGVIYTKGTINVNKDRINIRGGGIYVTTIYSDAGVVFNFEKTNQIINQCSISGVSFIGATTAQKIAIRVVDASEMDIRYMTTSYWRGSTSIGLQYRGRQQLTVDKCDFSTDRPISIEQNPNTRGIMDKSLIDIDHAHFSDLLLMAWDNTQAAVYIDDGVNLTNVLFDGYQAWVKGKYGLYWHDAGTIGVSSNLVLKNIRVENSGDDTGWLVYISHNYGLHNLIIENLSGSIATDSGLPLNGIYLKSVIKADISDSSVASTKGKTALSIDNTSKMIHIKNFTVSNAATITLGPNMRTLKMRKSSALEGWSEALFDRVDDTSAVAPWIMNDVKAWKSYGTLDNGASQGIQSVRFMETPLAYVDGVAMVSIIYIQPGNTSVHGASTFGCFGKATRTPNCVQMSTTDNTVVFGDVAGKVNLIRGGGTSEWEVRNQTGATIKFYIHMN